MKTIIYASWCQRPPGLETLLAILKTSRANNAAHRISGALLLVDSAFVQLLEGPAEAVDRLLGNIRRDRRHQGLVMLLEERHGPRTPMFADWSMAFCRLGAVDAVAGQGLQPLDLRPLMAVLDSFPERPASEILRAFVSANRGSLCGDAGRAAGPPWPVRAGGAPTG